MKARGPNRRTAGTEGRPGRSSASPPRPCCPQGQARGQGGWRTGPGKPRSVPACPKVTETHTRPGGSSDSRTAKLGRGVVLPSDAAILSHVFGEYFRKFLNQQAFKFLRRKQNSIKISSWVTHPPSYRLLTPQPLEPQTQRNRNRASLRTSSRPRCLLTIQLLATPTSLESHQRHVTNYVREESASTKETLH